MEIPTGESDRSAIESREQSGHEQKQQANVTGKYLSSFYIPYHPACSCTPILHVSPMTKDPYGFYNMQLCL